MSVSQPSIVPPQLARDVAAFARVLVAATRTQRLYSADHPAASTGIARLAAGAAALSPHGDLVIGVSPTTLMVNGEALVPDQRVGEAATLLHDRDILRLRFVSPPSLPDLSDFLSLLTLDADVVRERGGPAHVWRDYGRRSIEIDQVDYEALLADHGPVGPAGPPSPGQSAGGGGKGQPGAGTHDAVWRSLVRSMSSGGHASMDAGVRQRMLQIAKSPEAIHALTSEAVQALPTGQDSAIVAAQAATVLTTFERMVGMVEAHAPDQLPDTLRNVVAAASRLDPGLLMRAVGESAESGLGAQATGAMAQCFDDQQVARMLARSLASEGRASGRIAAALSTLAPDQARQDRVLRLARNLTTHGDVSNTTEFGTAWDSLTNMLSGPGDVVFASSEYSTSLQAAEARSHQLRMQAPDQLGTWMHSVSSESVRTLSVTLLLDLFNFEDRPDGVTDLAGDLAALAEDLLMSADTREAERVAQALSGAAAGPEPRRATAARLALDAIARSNALREMAPVLADVDQAQFEWFTHFCLLLGPVSLESLVPAIATTPDGDGRDRLESVIVQYGEAAVPALARSLDDGEWPVCRAAIHLLGRVGGAAAVAALHPLVRDRDVKKVREAVLALVCIDDPNAAKTLAVVLKAGSTGLRMLAIDALGSSRDHRAGTLLAVALRDADVLGQDHSLALRMLAALRLVGDEQVVPAIANTMRASSWLRFSRAGRLKRAATLALASMDTRRAAAALEDAAHHGDLLLRKHARAALAGGRT